MRAPAGVSAPSAATPSRPLSSLVPRAGTAIAYGLVGVAFLWETIGGVANAPGWTLDLSPFHHVGLVPAEPFQATGAVVMVAIGTVAALAATWVFDRRDLVAG